jgi:hypothetical protein
MHKLQRLRRRAKLALRGDWFGSCRCHERRQAASLIAESQVSIDLYQRDMRVSGLDFGRLVVHRSRQRMKIVCALRAFPADVAALVAMSGPAIGQNMRGSAAGPTTAKGYHYPDQFIPLKPVKPAEGRDFEAILRGP